MVGFLSYDAIYVLPKNLTPRQFDSFKQNFRIINLNWEIMETRIEMNVSNFGQNLRHSTVLGSSTNYQSPGFYGSHRR